MNERYDFEAIERKWQKRWAERDQFKADEQAGKAKFYVLEMLLILRARFTSAMSETTRSATRSLVSAACRDSMCCIPLAGTLSGSRRERRDQARGASR